MKLFLGLALIALAVGAGNFLTRAAASDKAKGPLVLNPTSCAAPCRVEIAGPALLLGLKSQHWQKWVGCSFGVDWSDGPLTAYASECSELMTHVYQKPGTYTVKATHFHPNPDDSHTIDWRGEATLTVR